MALSNFQITKLKYGLFTISISGFLGGAFALAMISSFGGSFATAMTRDYLRLGILTGLGVSTATYLLELRLTGFVPRPLWFDFIVVPSMQTAFIVVIYGTLYILIFGLEKFLKESWIVQTLVISYFFTAIFNIITGLNRLLGQNVLGGLILGTYRKPVNESRFVMFLDIAGSTAIAEKLGALEFHALLNDFFCDIAHPIVNHHGEIYKYVGDEVIITWKERAGAKNGNALRLFFEVDRTIEARREHYRGRYGLVPEYRAGLHFGSLVVGEMGFDKQEIAFSGDVMNTASRIQSECRALGERFLASDAALERLCPPGSEATGCTIVSCGGAKLRGKATEIGISAIR